MSYTIEYARQFIRSGSGITPLWLHGSSNCTEVNPLTRKEVRDRSWSPWMNLIGVPEKELLQKAEELKNEYDQHWSFKGQFLDNDRMLRWVQNGIKHAVPIEVVLEANKRTCAIAYVSVWRGEEWGKRELSAEICSTQDLDAWIEKAKEFIERETMEFNSAYPIIELPIWDFRPAPKGEISNNPYQMYVLKWKRRYVNSVGDDHVTYSPDPAEALRLDSQEARALLSSHCILRRKKVQMVKAEALENRDPHILAFADGRFVRSVSSTKVSFTLSRSTAHKYASKQAAKDACARIITKYGAKADGLQVIPLAG